MQSLKAKRQKPKQKPQHSLKDRMQKPMTQVGKIHDNNPSNPGVRRLCRLKRIGKRTKVGYTESGHYYTSQFKRSLRSKKNRGRKK